MRKRWIITIITTLAVGCAYFATYAIAKNAYENQIQMKINLILSDQFNDAFSVTYPFLSYSAYAISAKADAIKYIARDAGYDRSVFSDMWNEYSKTREANKILVDLIDFDFFIGSSAYTSLTYAGKYKRKEVNTIFDLIEAARLVKSPEDIYRIEELLDNANYANKYVSAFFSMFSSYSYRDDSHGLNDWKRFDTIKYSSKLMYYENLKKEPFSLYDFFFDNPLDKEIPNY